jgi:hypothetical protein
MSETTPLLTATAAGPRPQEPHDLKRKHDIDVYDRFTPPQKRLITTVISLAGLIGSES